MKQLTPEQRVLLERAVESKMIHPWGEQNRNDLVAFLQEILNANTAQCGSGGGPNSGHGEAPYVQDIETYPFHLVLPVTDERVADMKACDPNTAEDEWYAGGEIKGDYIREGDE